MSHENKTEEETVTAPESGASFTHWVEDQVRNTPWWMLSIAFHLIVLAGMTVITFREEIRSIEKPEIIPLARAEKKYELERPVDLFEASRGVKFAGAERTPEENDQPIIDFPEAKESNRNESANDDDHHQMLGQDLDALSSAWGDMTGHKGRQTGRPGPGVYDVLGPGGGGGGGARHGGPFGGREDLRKVGQPGGGVPTKTTENAVTDGLRWLARHQGPSGGWSAQGFHSQCSGSKCSGEGYSDFDSGETGLALLAFLGAGYTHLTRESYVDPVSGKTISWGTTIKDGLKWLLQNQDAEGCFGGRSSGKYMYNHAIAALAMTEAYGLTQSPLFRDAAQKGIDFLIAAQSPYKAWRYVKLSDTNDTSVTGWCVMALKSAEISGLRVSRTSYDGARAWIEEMTDSTYGKVGYRTRGDGKVVVEGKNEDWDGHEAMTAVGMLCRAFIDHNDKDPMLAHGRNLLMGDLPAYSGKKIDYYYWYYGSLALFQVDGAEGASFKKWNQAMTGALLPSQRTSKDGCARGSWESDTDRWGFEGGRVYATAINVLTLEVYYRYESAFGSSKRR
ncbi:MAG: terpene cyclase/mutase family protein [Planctomycetes bacterium]|nr:terpene cyclase/mutase family protein [Planctomycetota bacterium]